MREHYHVTKISGKSALAAIFRKIPFLALVALPRVAGTRHVGVAPGRSHLGRFWSCVVIGAAAGAGPAYSCAGTRDVLDLVAVAG